MTTIIDSHVCCTMFSSLIPLLTGGIESILFISNVACDVDAFELKASSLISHIQFHAQLTY